MVVIEILGVYDVPLLKEEPPDKAAYQLTVAPELGVAVSVRDPEPHRDAGVPVIVGNGLTVTITVSALLQPKELVTATL